jgi:hypothetical protein
MSLLGIVSSPNPIIHNDQSSPILRFGEYTSLDSLVQVGRSIRTNGSSRPHSSHNDYRLSTIDGGIHEESRFFKSIGSMGDYHRIDG